MGAPNAFDALCTEINPKGPRPDYETYEASQQTQQEDWYVYRQRCSDICAVSASLLQSYL